MPMNAVVISLFLGGLAPCIVTGASLLWALAFGLLCFTEYAFRLGFRPREIVGLCGRGVRTIGNILKIFVLIGMLTAVWRSAGTIPYIIHYCLPWVDPAHFHLSLHKQFRVGITDCSNTARSLQSPSPHHFRLR